MADDNAPWWKKIWPALVAVVLAILGTIVAVTGRSYLAGKQVADAQKKDNDVLNQRLKDANVVQDAKLDAVQAREELAKQKAQDEHAARDQAINDKAKQDAANLASNPDALPVDLLNSLQGAERKLQ